MGYLMQWVSLSFLISQSAWLIEAIVGLVCQRIVPLSSDNKKNLIDGIAGCLLNKVEIQCGIGGTQVLGIH